MLFKRYKFYWFDITFNICGIPHKHRLSHMLFVTHRLINTVQDWLNKIPKPCSQDILLCPDCRDLYISFFRTLPWSCRCLQSSHAKRFIRQYYNHRFLDFSGNLYEEHVIGVDPSC